MRRRALLKPRITPGGVTLSERIYKMARYQQAMCATDYLRSKVHYRPLVGIICGSGLGSIADFVSNPRIVRYDDIPGFPDCEG